MNTSLKIYAVFQNLALIVCALTISMSASSASSDIVAIQGRLENNQVALQRAEEELEYVQYKRQTTEKKLKDYQTSLEDKEKDLELLKQRVAESPTYENEQALRNEERRIELAGITIKSRVASVVRLENKEQELQRKVDSLRQKISVDTNKLRLARVDKKAEEKTDDLKRKLEALRRENEGLRAQKQAALDEIERRKLTEQQRAAEKARLAQALEKERQEKEEAERRLAKEEAEDLRLAQEELAIQKELEKQRALKAGQDPEKLAEEKREAEMASRVVTLAGEGIDQEYTFNYVGKSRFKAEAIVLDQKARVTVNGRTYKLKVEPEDVGETYVFMYDLSESDTPKLLSYKKNKRAQSQDTSLVSDNAQPF